MSSPRPNSYAVPIFSAVVKWLFVALVVAYVVLMLLSPQLGPGDEYHFLPTLQQGKPFPLYDADFPYYNTFELGRFSPLGGQEYNLVWPFTRSPVGYFIVNAVELASFLFIFSWLMRQYISKREFIYVGGLLLLLTSGFTLTFFKLLYVEKALVLLLAGFLALFVAFQRYGNVLLAGSVLAVANIALYYKETGFVAIGGFAAAHLLLAWKSLTQRQRAMDVALISCAVIYLATYFLYIVPQRGEFTYDTNFIENKALVYVKNLVNYALVSDPVPILLLLPLAAWRAYSIVVRRDQAHHILDPMIAAGVGYVAVFLVLNMYSPYYLLPVYVFAIPPFFYFLAKGHIRGLIWKGLFIVVALVMLANVIPLALHYIAYSKYLPINFNQTLDFLVSEIERRNENHRVRIYFDGVDRGGGRAVYFVVGEYFKFKGLSIGRFDLVSDAESVDKTPFISNQSPFDTVTELEAVDPQHRYKNPRFPFAVFQPGPAPQIQRGDYLIISPHSTKGYDSRYIDRFRSDANYRLAFHTESPFAIPRFDLKTWVKYYLTRRLTAEQKHGGVILNENIWSWPDYYVFVRN